MRNISLIDSLSNSVPVEGQWEDQLSPVEELSVESRFTFQSTLDNSFSLRSGDWKLYGRQDRKNQASSIAIFSETTPYPVTPATPTTIGSTSDSFISSSKLAATDQDSISDESEAGSTNTLDSSKLHATSANSWPVSIDYQQAVTSPHIRDQMLYYMRKHLKTSQPKTEDEKKLE